MVQFPFGIHFKERMEYDDVIATEKRRTVGLMPRYSAYFLDKGIWYEIAYGSGNAIPVEEKKKMKQYGENNVVLLDFEGQAFVRSGQILRHFSKSTWSHSEKGEKHTDLAGGVFYLDIPVYIHINEKLIVRFANSGYEEITPVAHASMVNEIAKKLHDDGVLLEWVTASGSLRALLPDRMVRLGCEELRTCIVRADMITPVHSSRDIILYKVAKDHWDPLATSFTNNYQNEIERIYHEICKK